MRNAISITFLQYFHNKLQVISCYWFKFEHNTKITILPQEQQQPATSDLL